MTTAFAEVKSFPIAETLPEALRRVKSAGYEALFAPEFGQERVKNPNNSELRPWHQTLTGIYTGRTERGARVVAIAHVPHYLSSPGNIEAAIGYGLNQGAAETPQIAAEMPKLLKLEGQGVFVIPYEQWDGIKSGLYTLDQALEHPTEMLVTAFLGGRQKAENYLNGYHSKAVGSDIRILKTNDPDGTARLAVFGNDFSNNLVADYYLDYVGRFAGVQRAEGATAQNSPLEGLTGKGTDVGHDLIVVRKEDIGPDAYGLLTAKQ